MKISKELEKYLNERVKDILLSGKVPGNKVLVAWTLERVFWAELKTGKWCLRSASRRPKRILIPRELDVDLGIKSASLSGVIPWQGTVSSMM